MGDRNEGSGAVTVQVIISHRITGSSAKESLTTSVQLLESMRIWQAFAAVRVFFLSADDAFPCLLASLALPSPPDVTTATIVPPTQLYLPSAEKREAAGHALAAMDSQPLLIHSASPAGAHADEVHASSAIASNTRQQQQRRLGTSAEMVAMQNAIAQQAATLLLSLLQSSFSEACESFDWRHGLPADVEESCAASISAGCAQQVALALLNSVTETDDCSSGDLHVRDTCADALTIWPQAQQVQARRLQASEDAQVRRLVFFA